jgi:organic radical activating enzyme
MPFNADENIGASQLKNKYNLSENTLFVRSMFHTFQGEAPYTGESAVFLRTGGCNRGAKQESCAKFLQCDTDFLQSKSKVMTIEEVIAEICKLKLAETELLVITGGEPLLQQAAIIKLCETITGNSEYEKLWSLLVQIETNGDVSIKAELTKYATIIASPKAWEGVADPWKSLRKENFSKIRYFRHLISADEKSPYHTINESILQYCLQESRAIYLSPITVYNDKAKQTEIDKGWAGNAIYKKATLANYSYAAHYASTLAASGICARLSSQSHLLYGIA